MRKAQLIKEYIEDDNQGDRILCEFHKTIEMDDVPPLGYTVIYPEDKGVAKFHVERANIQNKSGILTLYSTMTIYRYENWNYEPSILNMLSMRRRGWTIIKPHEKVRELWKEAQKNFKSKKE